MKTSKSLQSILFGLAAMAGIFLLAGSGLDFYVKIAIFAGIVAVFLLLNLPLLRAGFRTGEPLDRADDLFDAEVESRLFALEEANQFFGTSLRPADMFRLAVSRINELIPFSAAVVFFVNEDERRLEAAYADGRHAAFFRKLELGRHTGLAGKTYMMGHGQIDFELSLEKYVLPKEISASFEWAMAVPLFREGEIFGVLQLYMESPASDVVAAFRKKADITLLEAVAARVTPFFISSIAFEKSLANALNDPVTNLPNERAFYLVLETHLAESVRNPEDRPLSVLAMDIRGFDEVNRRFGHKTGDRMLLFVAEVTKKQLRKMNFFSRSLNDEFLIVLPTVSEEIVEEIIRRIRSSFDREVFELAEDVYASIELNFGSATFSQDGETAQQLLQTAQLRKQQTKPERTKLLWLQRNLVN